MPAVSACVSGGSGFYLNRANPSGSAANIRASHTIMGRVKFTATTSGERYDPLAYDDNSDFSGTFFGKGTGTTTVCRGGRQNSSATFQGVSPASTVDTTTWRHFAVVYDATAALITYYVDGVSVGTQASATTYVSSAAGTDLTIYAAIARAKQADMAVFNRALSAGEVADMAAYRVAQVTSGLVGFWRFDANANDSSGNANNFTNAGSGTAVTYSTADPPPQPENPPIAIDGDVASSSAFAGTLTNTRHLVGAAASSSAFAGTLNTTKPVAGATASSSALSAALTNQLQIAGSAASSSALGAWLRPRWGRRVANGSQLLVRSASAFPATAWTFMSWVRPISIGTDTHTSLFQMSATTFSGARIGVRRTSGVVNTYILGDDNSTTVLSYQAANDSDWHHMAVTYDGATFRAYVDGSQVSSAAGTSTGTVNLFSLSASASAVAEFAHVKAWSGVALSAGQISSEATYYTPHVANAQLHAWWQLSWQGPTLDSSGNGNTLTDNGSIEAQTESPGAPLQLLAGSAASSSALAGTLNTTKPLFGNAVSQSVFQGTVTVSVPLAGGTASSSSFSASLTALLTGNAASSTSFAASLTTLKPIAGNAASSSAFAAALTALLAGSASSSSAFTGALGQALGVTGPLASSSALSGILGIQGAFGGVLQSSSALAATMFVQKPVAGDAASSSALSAAMVQNYAIASALASASALGGALTVQLDIQGSLTSTSALGGTLTVPLNIQGAMASVSALSATLGTAITISGALASGSAFSASLTAEIAGNAASASALSAQMRLLNTLVGNAASSSVLTGNMTVLSQRALAANAASSSQLIGALRVTVPAAASGNVVTSGSAKALYGPGDIPSGRIPRRWPPRY